MTDDDNPERLIRDLCGDVAPAVWVHARHDASKANRAINMDVGFCRASSSPAADGGLSRIT
jgi:hypothetical protein